MAALEQLAIEWKALVDEFQALCHRAGIHPLERRDRLKCHQAFMLKSPHPDVELKIARAHNNMIGFVNAHFEVGEHGPIYDFIQHLIKDRIDPDLRAIYVDYFEVITGNDFPPDRGVFI